MRTIFFISFMLFTFSVLAQEDEVIPEEVPDKIKVPDVRQTIKGDFKIPTPTYNKSFTKTVNGIADMSLHYNYPVFRYFTAGVGFKFTYLQINDFKTNVKTNASVKVYTPFVRLGFEKFTRPKFFYGLHLKTGYSTLNFYSNICDSLYGDSGAPKDKGFYIEPEISFYLMASDNLAFGIQIAYNVIFDQYGPDNVCLPNFSGMSASDSQGNYQFFSLGFGFSASISKERKKRGRETIYW